MWAGSQCARRLAATAGWAARSTAAARRSSQASSSRRASATRPPREVAAEVGGADLLDGAAQVAPAGERGVDHAEVRGGKGATDRLFGVEASAHDPPFPAYRGPM